MFASNTTTNDEKNTNQDTRTGGTFNRFIDFICKELEDLGLIRTKLYEKFKDVAKMEPYYEEEYGGSMDALLDDDDVDEGNKTSCLRILEILEDVEDDDLKALTIKDEDTEHVRERIKCAVQAWNSLCREKEVYWEEIWEEIDEKDEKDERFLHIRGFADEVSSQYDAKENAEKARQNVEKFLSFGRLLGSAKYANDSKKNTKQDTHTDGTFNRFVDFICKELEDFELIRTKLYKKFKEVAKMELYYEEEYDGSMDALLDDNDVDEYGENIVFLRLNEILEDFEDDDLKALTQECKDTESFRKKLTHAVEAWNLSDYRKKIACQKQLEKNTVLCLGSALAFEQWKKAGKECILDDGDIDTIKHAIKAWCAEAETGYSESEKKKFSTALLKALGLKAPELEELGRDVIEKILFFFPPLDSLKLAHTCKAINDTLKKHISPNARLQFHFPDAYRSRQHKIEAKQQVPSLKEALNAASKDAYARLSDEDTLFFSLTKEDNLEKLKRIFSNLSSPEMIQKFLSLREEGRRGLLYYVGRDVSLHLFGMIAGLENSDCYFLREAWGKNALLKLSHLHLAARLGLSEEIKKALQNGETKVNDLSQYKYSALHYAIMRNCLSAVKLLIELGADATQAGFYGLSPLCLALDKSIVSLEIVKELIKADKGAGHINRKSNALIVAAENGNLSIVEELIKAGATINPPGYNVQTPLCAALKYKQLNVVKKLIKLGVKVDENALRLAVNNPHLPILQYLVEEIGVSIRDHPKYFLPLVSGLISDPTMVKSLLKECGAGANRLDNDGYSPLLILAIKYGHVDIVKILFQETFTLLDFSDNDREKLKSFIEANHENLKLGYARYLSLVEKNQNVHDRLFIPEVAYLKRLLKMSSDRGNFLIGNKIVINRDVADVNKCGKDGWGPVHYAASCGNIEILTYLLEKGGDITQQDDDGQTPLHHAASCGNIEILKYLLEKGGDITQQDDDGRTPLHHAVTNRHLKIEKGLKIHDSTKPLLGLVSGKHPDLSMVKYLRQAGVKNVNQEDNKGYSPLMLAIKHGNADIVENLVQETCTFSNKINQGADVNTPSTDGWRPLCYAVTHWNVEIVTCLLKKGAGINLTNMGTGQAPLHYAAKQEHFIEVNTLIREGANVNLRNTFGKTPLHYAAKYGNLSAVIDLILEGANVDLQDMCGKTPLHYAAENRHVKIVEYFLEKGADANLLDNDGLSAVSLAIEYEYFDVAMLMIKTDYAYLCSLTDDQKDTLLLYIKNADDINSWYFNYDLVKEIEASRKKSDEASESRKSDFFKSNTSSSSPIRNEDNVKEEAPEKGPS